MTLGGIGQVVGIAIRTIVDRVLKALEGLAAEKVIKGAVLHLQDNHILDVVLEVLDRGGGVGTLVVRRGSRSCSRNGQEAEESAGIHDESEWNEPVFKGSRTESCAGNRSALYSHSEYTLLAARGLAPNEKTNAIKLSIPRVTPMLVVSLQIKEGQVCGVGTGLEARRPQLLFIAIHQLEMYLVRLAARGASLDLNAQFVGIDRHVAGKTVV